MISILEIWAVAAPNKIATLVEEMEGHKSEAEAIAAEGEGWTSPRNLGNSPNLGS